MRIAGLDVGKKTIGIAVSDELNIIAQGIETIDIDADNNNYGFKRLKKLIAMYEINKFVVGIPRNMNGTYGAQADFCNAYINKLEDKFNLPVYKHDERLTTVQANKVLEIAGVHRDRRKAVIDQLAAVLILQNFLDTK